MKKLVSLCKKTPNTALLSFLKQSFTSSKLLYFKNFESLVFDVFLSKTLKCGVFLQTVIFFLILFVSHANAQEFSYKEKKELKSFPDYIMQSGFSPFRNYFAITIGNNTIEIYDKDWNKIFSHQGNPKSVGGHYSFSPDEKYLAYAKYKSDNDIAII